MVAALLLAVFVYRSSDGGSRELEPPVLDPATWFSPQWEDALGGDSPTPQWQIDLPTIAAATDLSSQDLQPVTRLLYDLATASASGTGRDPFGTYFAKNHEPVSSAPRQGLCTDVKVEAVSPYYLPLSPRDSLVKAMVLWRGTCPYPPPSIAPPGTPDMYLNFLYAARHDVLVNRAGEDLVSQYSGWVPARPAELPGSSAWQKFSASTPADFELGDLVGCSLPGVKLRIEVVSAYAALCSEADSAGIPLMAATGYRTPAAQKSLFDAAVKRYGSDRAARARVAYSDGVSCESMHCAAEAVDLVPNDLVGEWLSEVVACVYQGRAYQVPCQPGHTPVLRLERYGFSSPHSQHGYHLEYVLGTLSADADLYGDCTPGGLAIPLRVDLVFRCRMLEAGLGAELATIVSAEARAVAACTSAFDPGFRSFGGAYATTPNPATGLRDDRSGIFGLSSAVASRWIPPGESVYSATSNIDAAARMFIDERSWGGWGWGLFACATADDGTVASSVLPR